MTSIATLLLEAADTIGGESARRDAEVILGRVLRRPRAWLFAHSDEIVDGPLEVKARDLISRRAAGEPVAYLLQSREFWSLELLVTPATLIPRPETELLVEVALQLPLPAAACRVVDLGTGSGAIALALAAERPHWTVEGVDRSAAALEVAVENARRHGLERVRFRQADWLDGIGQRSLDLIVSNPPYVAADDPCLRRGDLRHEPLDALAAGADGCDDLARIAVAAPSRLRPGGWIVLEHGPEQGGSVRGFLTEAGFIRVGSREDGGGQERVSFGQLE